ncbi:hypothetical protein NW762_010884 [Fusarium torreyae]|uniref:Uncharacterized protein n=1 Tax=Fusarium torreyae TaxID=1237075 RepID=A0A9W8RU33_9HYPO|nr:hypothetical protein NW762_010884 [Fusarium torreyae]
MPSAITKAITTSILFPDFQNLGYTITGGVRDVGDDGAIIYEIQLPTDDKESGNAETTEPGTITITDGPWATDSASGQFEFYYSTRQQQDPSDIYREVQSIHCELSKTVARECTMAAEQDSYSSTKTYTNRKQLESIYAYKFSYYPFVITSGQALLDYRSSVLATYTPTITGVSSEEEESGTASAEASDNTEESASTKASSSTGASTSNPTSTESTTAETSTSDATEESSTPEPTSGASSGLLRVYASMAAAAVVMMAVSL